MPALLAGIHVSRAESKTWTASQAQHGGGRRTSHENRAPALPPAPVMFANRPPRLAAVVVIVPIIIASFAIAITVAIEVEHIEQVADRRHVARHIGVVVMLRVGEVVAAARCQLLLEPPVPLDEFHERGMLVVDVADAPAGRER